MAGFILGCIFFGHTFETSTQPETLRVFTEDGQLIQSLTYETLVRTLVISPSGILFGGGALAAVSAFIAFLVIESWSGITYRELFKKLTAHTVFKRIVRSKSNEKVFFKML
ncbi:hypothetical protein [Anaerohalosphaera lusitana]|uniref:hypothetical protein n=1 Tax=Anaerohalosphaera lusitana TaxID=1936003 RepID=UPI0011BA874D|nr:hypothetical protein [Anaerohalosphaera lusitana]